MKNYLSKYNNIIVAVLAFIVLLAVNMAYGISGNSIIELIAFPLIIFLFNKALKIRDDKIIKISAITSVIFSLFEVFGMILNTSLSLKTNMNFLQIAVIFIGMFILVYAALVLLFDYTKNKDFTSTGKKGFEFFKANKKSFLAVWLLIFICWTPYFLAFFPGILSNDSVNQIGQTIGFNTLMNHHPVCHTLIISIFIHIGFAFTKAYTAGVIMYSVFQMLVMSAVFSFTIYYMAKKSINIYFRFASFFFYALYPVNGMYSITMWKDVFFGAIFLLLTIFLFEISSEPDNFFKSKKLQLLFFLNILGLLFFRNNGIYIFIIMVPFLFICFKKYWKNISAIVISCFLVYAIVNGPVFKLLNVRKGSFVEALSVPMQQIARTVRDHESDLSKEDIDDIEQAITIKKNMPYYGSKTETIKKVYNPRLSDPIKDMINMQYVSVHKYEYIHLWFSLFLKYPKTYIESFLCNNYGYWYPEASNWVAGNGIAKNAFHINLSSFLPDSFRSFLYSLCCARSIPVISMLFSIGFSYWTSYLCAVICWLKRNKRLLIAFLPALGMWITMVIASPVYAEYRYNYGLFLSMPIFIAMSIFMKSYVKNKE